MSSSAAVAQSETNHLVQFYADDDELVESVVDHVLGGSDSVASLIVATEEHRHLIERRLSAGGHVGRSRRGVDAVILLDAGTVLHTFFDGERIDAQRFDEAVGSVVRRRVRTRRPVRVYGEMVALLWDAGHLTAALELEGLWNELAAEVSFSLLCGYPNHATLAGTDAIRSVCDAHTVVLGRPRLSKHAEARRTFDRAVGAPSEVRRFVAATLHEWNAVGRLEDIILVADELATNAVLHARSDVAVTLTSNAESVRVAVADRSVAEPRPANRGANAMSGRGLHIIDSVASAWGHQRTGTGKIVWARFDPE